MLAFASLMIGEGVQNSARLPVGPTVAGIHDTHQFHLQPPKPLDPIPDIGNPILRDALRVAMGCLGRFLQSDQFGDGVEVEAELPGMGDEGQPIQLGVTVATLPSARATGIGQEATPLIEADRCHLHAGALRKRADGMAVYRNYFLNLQLL